MVAGFLLSADGGMAQSPPSGGTNSSPTYTPLASWSFLDRTNWTSDQGVAPVSFTNLGFSYLGDGSSLVVNTNVPAWLRFNVGETNGATNLTVKVGTVLFWFAPGWSSTNLGGTGPGEWGRLLEVGGYTPDSSYGLWSIYVDDVGEQIYFSTQTNDISSNLTTYVSAPITWHTNYFHQVALTYSATNTALYLDGALAASGAPLTVYPGLNVLTNGFYIGSDGNGENQARGLFSQLATYAVPLDANSIQQKFDAQFFLYLMNPNNRAMGQIYAGSNSVAALSQPSSSPSYFNVISGMGYLQYVGSDDCVTSGNVWLTNVTATAASQPMTVNFSIAGGMSGGLYDVFATPALASSLTGGIWTWLGQGWTCSRYTIPSLPVNGAVFFMLGTAQDTDGDGLTDAYEELVSHSDPEVVDTDGNGLPDGWQVLHFGGIGNNPMSDPDQDGLINLKEYRYGTRPTVSEGLAVWTAAVGNLP